MGWGGGQGCVCRGALRPSSRLAPAWPAPPPSCVVCTHAPAHRRARAAPGHLQLAHVWAHAPLPAAATGHLLPRLGCLCLTRSVDSRAAGPGLSISSSHPPPLLQTPVGTLVLLAGVSHGHVRARRWTRPLQLLLRLSAPPALFHSSTLSGPLLSQLAVSPPSSVYPFSKSSTSVPQRDF